MTSSSGRFKSSRKRVVVFVAIAVDPYHNSFHHSSLSLSPRSVNSSTFFAAHAVADERQAIFSCPCCRGTFRTRQALSKRPTRHWSYSSSITWTWLKGWRNWTDRDLFQTQRLQESRAF